LWVDKEKLFHCWKFRTLECPRDRGLDWQTKRHTAPKPESLGSIAVDVRCHRLRAVGSQGRRLIALGFIHQQFWHLAPFVILVFWQQ
jgi:hypothetical protein